MTADASFPTVATEAEMAVAGYCINDPLRAFETLNKSGFRVEDVLLPIPKVIIQFVINEAAKGKAPDFVQLATELSIRAPGSSSAVLTEYAQMAFDPRGLPEWLRILREFAQRRAARALAQKQLERVQAGEPLLEIASSARGWADTVAQQTERPRDDWQALIARQIEAYAQPPDPNRILSTGFPLLDDRFLIERGDYLVIGGATGAGKSMLGIQLACQMLEGSDQAALICSLEMPTAQIIDRIISREASVYGSTLKRRLFTQADFTRIQGAIGRTLNRALHIRDDCHDLQSILANARALHAQKKLRVLLVDYLQIIRGPDKELREQQVAAISRELRLLALETGAVVIALCQLNRNGEARESAAITMDATQFLAIHRANTEGKRHNPTDDDEEEDRNKRILEIRKIRDGECGELEMGFDGGCSRFYELR